MRSTHASPSSSHYLHLPARPCDNGLRAEGKKHKKERSSTPLSRLSSSARVAAKPLGTAASSSMRNAKTSGSLIRRWSAALATVSAALFLFLLCAVAATMRSTTVDHESTSKGTFFFATANAIATDAEEDIFDDDYFYGHSAGEQRKQQQQQQRQKMSNANKGSKNTDGNVHNRQYNSEQEQRSTSNSIGASFNAPNSIDHNKKMMMNLLGIRADNLNSEGSGGSGADDTDEGSTTSRGMRGGEGNTIHTVRIDAAREKKNTNRNEKAQDGHRDGADADHRVNRQQRDVNQSNGHQHVDGIHHVQQQKDEKETEQHQQQKTPVVRTRRRKRNTASSGLNILTSSLGEGATPPAFSLKPSSSIPIVRSRRREQQNAEEEEERQRRERQEGSNQSDDGEGENVMDDTSSSDANETEMTSFERERRMRRQKKRSGSTAMRNVRSASVPIMDASFLQNMNANDDNKKDEDATAALASFLLQKNHNNNPKLLNALLRGKLSQEPSYRYRNSRMFAESNTDITSKNNNLLSATERGVKTSEMSSPADAFLSMLSPAEMALYRRRLVVDSDLEEDAELLYNPLTGLSALNTPNSHFSSVLRGGDAAGPATYGDDLLSIYGGLNAEERNRRLAFSAQEDDATSTCEASCDRNRGTCSGGTCVCFEDASKGFWDGTWCSECLEGYAGPDCKSECRGGSCNQCSNNGRCSMGTTGDGSCTCFNDETNGFWAGEVCNACAAGYYGPKCLFSCPGLTNGNGQICFGRGTCNSGTFGDGVCTCETNWGSGSGCYNCDDAHYSMSCTLPCVGFRQGRPCSGHGKCNSGTTGDGTCICDDQYGSRDCSQKCETVNNFPCSGHGRCNSGADRDGKCVCEPSWAPPNCGRCVASKTGSSCQLECKTGLRGLICSGNGQCDHKVDFGQEIAICICGAGYRGETCEIACPGDPPCSGKGVCAEDNTCQCFKDSVHGFWDGAFCDHCDIRYNGSSTCTARCPTNPSGVICSGQGTCRDGKCFCVRNDPDTGISYCDTACDKRSYEEYIDPYNPNECEKFYCKDYSVDSECKLCPGDCSGRGLCDYGKTATAQCFCSNGWSGTDCALKCPDGPNITEPCSGFMRGYCTYDRRENGDEYARCQCRPQFTGEFCEINCPMVNGAVCNAPLGTCLMDGTCECITGYTGLSCSMQCGCDAKYGNCVLDECIRTEGKADNCTVCECNTNFIGSCNACEPGFQGELCDGPCVHGTTVGKECECEPFYSYPNCSIPCPVGNNGAVCSGNGTCFWGKQFQSLCQCFPLDNPTYFGEDCSVFCTPQMCRDRGLLHTQCNPITGVCECQSNAQGMWAIGSGICDECQTGYWGQTCSETCDCNDKGSCDQTTGVCSCFSDSERGYFTGSQCQSCQTGYIGVGCKRRSVSITRIKMTLPTSQEVLLQLPQAPLAEHRVNTVMYDEDYEQLQIGSSPFGVYKFNTDTSSFSLQRRSDNAAGQAFFSCAQTTCTNASDPTTCTTNRKYAEIAYVFRHQESVYYITQPSKDCGWGPRIAQLRRGASDFVISDNPIVEIDTERKYINTTMRIVSIVSQHFDSDEIFSIPPALVFFVAVQQYRDTLGQIRTWPGGVACRVDFDSLNIAGDLGKFMFYDFLPHGMTPTSIAVQQFQMAVPDFFAVGGHIGDTWDVFAFRVDSEAKTLVPAYQNDVHQTPSIRKRVPCWPSQNNVEEAECVLANCYCRYCSSVRFLHFKDYALSLTIQTGNGVVQALLQRLQDLNQGDQVLAEVGSLCLQATFSGGALSANNDQRSVFPCASSAICNDVEYYVLMSPSDLPDSVPTAIAFDYEASVTYVAVTMGSAQSQLLKFSMKSEMFGLYGVLLLEFQTFQDGNTQRTVPETITCFSIGRKSRVMFAGLSGLSRVIPLTFFLYEIQEFRPNIADNRGGTNITIVGSGFRRQTLNPNSQQFFNMTCNFGRGQFLVPAEFISFTELRCVAPRYVEDTALSDSSSCDGQSVEVTIYQSKWFTTNNQNIQRVQPASLTAVTPDRGATTQETVVLVTGSQFVDSEFARCRFNSTNSQDAYYSRIVFINSTAIRCTQPIAKAASVDRALIDVSHDGQMYTETDALDYQIVGSPSAILTDPAYPTIMLMRAEFVNRFSVRTYIVDEERHRLGNLDTSPRVVFLKTDLVMEQCTDSTDHRVPVDGFPWPPCRNVSVNNLTNGVEYFNENISTSWINRTDVIGMDGNGNGGVLALRGTSDGVTNRGFISFNDLYFLEPRKGIVTISFLEEQSGWATKLIIEIREGPPYALTVGSRADFGESGVTPNKFYINTDGALSVKQINVIVVDILGNIVKDSLVTQNYTVSASAFQIHDGTTARVLDNTTLISPPKLEETFFAFNDIKMMYRHGMDHFLWFTAVTNHPSVLPIKDFISPPIRTALCSDAYYYKVPGSDMCLPCPSNGAVCNATESIIVLPGYWRGPNVTTSIYSCKGGAMMCLGSLGAPSGSTCAPAYEGPLCSICKNGYGKSGDECVECGAFWWMMTSILLVVIVVFGAVVVWSIMSLRKAETTDMSVVLRTLMNHMQATGELGQFSKEFDPFVRGLFNIQAATTSFSIGGVQSLDCVLKEFGANYEAIFYAYMSIPVLAVIIGIVVTIVVRVMGLQPVITEKLRGEILEDIRVIGPHAKTAVILHTYPVYMVLITTLSVTLFTVYQMLITQSTNVLTCKEYIVAGSTDAPVVKYFLELDLSVECNSQGQHSFTTPALLFAVIYGFGIPLAFVCGHIYINSRISKPELTKLMFLFLTGGYKEQFWFWQAIIMIRKMALVSVVVFLTDGMLQSYAATWVMSVALVLQTWLNPAEKPEHNLVEAISLVIITITLNLSLLYFWKGLPEFGKTVLTMLLLVVTLGAICMFAYFMFEPVKQQVFENLAMAIEVIRDFTQKKKREERAALREQRRIRAEEKKKRKEEDERIRQRAEELRNRNRLIENGNAEGAAGGADDDYYGSASAGGGGGGRGGGNLDVFDVVDDTMLDAPELLDTGALRNRRHLRVDKRALNTRQRMARGILDGDPLGGDGDDDNVVSNNNANTNVPRNTRFGNAAAAASASSSPVRADFSTLQQLYDEEDANNELFDLAFGGSPTSNARGRRGARYDRHDDDDFDPIGDDVQYGGYSSAGSGAGGRSVSTYSPVEMVSIRGVGGGGGGAFAGAPTGSPNDSSSSNAATIAAAERRMAARQRNNLNALGNGAYTVNGGGGGGGNAYNTPRQNNRRWNEYRGRNNEDGTPIPPAMENDADFL